MQVSQKMLQAMVERLAVALNRPKDEKDKSGNYNVGHLMLEHTPPWGYRLIEIKNTQGHTFEPLGSNSHPKAELFWMLWAIHQQVSGSTLPRFETASLGGGRQ